MPLYLPYAAAFIMAAILSMALAVIMGSMFFKKKKKDQSDRSFDSIDSATAMLDAVRHQIALVQTLSLGTPDHEAALHRLVLLLNQAKAYFPAEIAALSRLIANFNAVPAGNDAFVAPLLETHAWLRRQTLPV